MASKNAHRAANKFAKTGIGKIIFFILGIAAIIILLFKLLTTGSIR